MTLEQLEFVVAVQREGTIWAAAQSLNISHSSVSRAISSLEDELGVNIFIRSRAGTAVTEEGERVIESAQRILSEIAALRDLPHSRQARQEINISAFPVDSMFFLPELVMEFRERCDYAVINLSQSGISEVIAKVKGQQTDLGLVALPPEQEPLLQADMVRSVLFESWFAVACSFRSPLAGKPYVTPEEIMDMEYPLILHDDAMIIASLKQIFKGKLPAKILSYTNDNSFIKQMVAEGGALSIYTALLAECDPRIISGELCLVPLRSGDTGEVFKVAYMALHHKKKQLSQAERLFLRMLTERTKQWRGEERV